MIQKEIRQHNGKAFEVTEAAEWLKELDDRTKSTNPNYNSINDLSEKLGAQLPTLSGSYSVSKLINPELEFTKGVPLNRYTSYRVKMTVKRTGVTHGSCFLLTCEGSYWTIKTVYKTLNGSNVPYLIQKGGKVKVKIDHSSTYTIVVSIEGFLGNHSYNTDLGLWGADAMFKKINGNIGVNLLESTMPSEKFDVNGKIKCYSVVQVSDRKFKTNIELIDGEWALSIYKKLKFSFYDFSITNTKQAGLIAQEVEKILPQAVSTTESGEKGLDYNYIDIISKAAIQHFIKTQIK